MRLDRLLGQPQALGDAGIRPPLGHQREHLALARRELVECAAPGRGDQRGHHLRVQRRAARGHAPRRLEEVVDVEHAVLEQVAEAAAGGDELDDVAGLDVLGEHQHRRVRVLAADPAAARVPSSS